MNFYQALQKQRWDDHRLYHHSRINQTLHFLSALSFLSAYVLVASDPVLAVALGWFVAMILRQIGHFFFEPKEYDEVNKVSHEHKEGIKIGYNLKRKVILLSIWVLIPVALKYSPSMFGLLEPYADMKGYSNNLAVMWLALALGALVFRSVHLFFLYNVQTGVVWFTKILTEPFHDVKIYWRSPLYLMKGQLIDPMDDVTHRQEESEFDDQTANA